MKQLQGGGMLTLAILAGACTQAANDDAKPDDSAPSGNSSVQASLDREPPAFAAYVPPPQKAAALAAWRAASFELFLHFGVYSTFGVKFDKHHKKPAELIELARSAGKAATC